eukprot:jgi/Mesvir1/2400/Mv22142-RA.1
MSALENAGGLELIMRFFKATGRFVDGRGVQPLIYHISVPIGILSCFLHNTPIVAMMLPVIIDYARAHHLAPSKLLIPLSYSTVLGGTISVLGTSTNLVVLGLAQEVIPDLHFGIFDLAPVGLPFFFAGILYLGLFAGRFLPSRKGTSEAVENPREYMVEMIVQDSAPFIGKTVEKAGLRNLLGLFLARVEREGESTPAPGPDFVVQSGDKLFFAGEVDSVLQLTAVKGLRLADEQAEEKDLHQLTRTEEMVEVTLSNSSPLVNKTVRETQFRSHYKAAIVAVHRAGERIHGRIGDIRLQMADNLLLVTQPDFCKLHQRDAAFSLVSRVNHFRPVQRRMRWFALLVALAMIVVPSVTQTGVDLLLACWVACAIYLITNIITAEDARACLDWKILITIAAAFGISTAISDSGAADLIANGIVKLSKPFGKWGFLTFTYIATTLFTSVVTNSAAVAIMFPIAYSVMLQDPALSIDEILITLMLSASDYITPIGYQTNMMVFGPGGYRFSDYTKFGGALQVWLLIVAIPLIIWKKYWYIFTIGFVAANLVVFFWSIRGPRQALEPVYSMPRELRSVGGENGSKGAEGDKEGSTSEPSAGSLSMPGSVISDEKGPLQEDTKQSPGIASGGAGGSIPVPEPVMVDIEGGVVDQVLYPMKHAGPP